MGMSRLGQATQLSGEFLINSFDADLGGLKVEYDGLWVVILPLQGVDGLKTIG